MKIAKKINQDVINYKKCFLYFFEKEPKCFLTNLLTYSKDINIFDNDDEKNHFECHDCNGDFSNCLYIDALWEKEDVEDLPLLNFNNLNVDFDYSLPFEKDVRTDALLIPTNTNLSFYNFIDFGENNTFLINECRKRQLPFEEGDVVKTSGVGTGFPILLHCVIMDSAEMMPDVINVGLSLYNALEKAEEEGCKSISIHPLVVLDGDISMPSINLYIKTCLTTIKTFSEEYEIENLEYILIHIPSNFILNLQELSSNI
jgi:hypothetical protein